MNDSIFIPILICLFILWLVLAIAEQVYNRCKLQRRILAADELYYALCRLYGAVDYNSRNPNTKITADLLAIRAVIRRYHDLLEHEL